MLDLSLKAYEQNRATYRCGLGYRCSWFDGHSKLPPATYNLGAKRLREQSARDSSRQRQVGRAPSQVSGGQADGVGSILRVKFDRI